MIISILRTRKYFIFCLLIATGIFIRLMRQSIYQSAAFLSKPHPNNRITIPDLDLLQSVLKEDNGLEKIEIDDLGNIRIDQPKSSNEEANSAEYAGTADDIEMGQPRVGYIASMDFSITKTLVEPKQKDGKRVKSKGKTPAESIEEDNKVEKEVDQQEHDAKIKKPFTNNKIEVDKDKPNSKDGTPIKHDPLDKEGNLVTLAQNSTVHKLDTSNLPEANIGTTSESPDFLKVGVNKTNRRDMTRNVVEHTDNDDSSTDKVDSGPTNTLKLRIMDQIRNTFGFRQEIVNKHEILKMPVKNESACENTENGCKYLMGHLRGRLGNQLFIYAAVVSLAYQFDRIPIICINNAVEGKIYIYTVFDLQVPIRKEFCNAMLAKRDTVLLDEAACCKRDPKLLNDLRNMSDSVRAVHISGYFQSYTYWSSIADNVRAEFQCRSNFSHESAKKLQNMLSVKNVTLNDTNTVIVGIHARRGDLLHEPQRRVAATQEYLDRATDWYRDHYEQLHPRKTRDKILAKLMDETLEQNRSEVLNRRRRWESLKLLRQVRKIRGLEESKLSHESLVYLKADNSAKYRNPSSTSERGDNLNGNTDNDEIKQSQIENTLERMVALNKPAKIVTDKHDKSTESATVQDSNQPEDGHKNMGQQILKSNPSKIDTATDNNDKDIQDHIKNNNKKKGKRLLFTMLGDAPWFNRMYVDHYNTVEKENVTAANATWSSYWDSTVYYRTRFPSVNDVVVSPNYPLSDVGIDFCLLTMTDHLVISTGSFGWWAGFLNENAAYNGGRVSISRMQLGSELITQIEPDLRTFALAEWIKL